MIKIKDINCGIVGIATHLEVKILSFSTTDKSCVVYYQLVQSELKKPNEIASEADGVEYEVVRQAKRICEGNINIDEEDFEKWGSDNEYIENIVIKSLNLERE